MKTTFHYLSNRKGLIVMLLFCLCLYACDDSITDCSEDLITPLSSTTTIGAQEWSSANCNVFKFRNGEIIKKANNLEEWNRACDEGTPVWCYPQFRCDLGKIYGKIYNYHAIHDSRGLAPSGWKIPTIDDFNTLKMTIGGYPETLGLFDTTTNILTSYNINSCLFPLLGAVAAGDASYPFGSTQFKAILTGEFVQEADNLQNADLGETTSFWTTSRTSAEIGYYIRLNCPGIEKRVSESNREFHFVRLIK